MSLQRTWEELDKIVRAALEAMRQQPPGPRPPPVRTLADFHPAPRRIQ